MSGHDPRHAVYPGRQPVPPPPPPPPPPGSYIGRPWIRSAITPTTTAVLIGGQRHGDTIDIPDLPRPTLVVDEDGQQVIYRLVVHNGVHWCYVDLRPAAPTRTTHAHERPPLTIDYHHRDLLRDAWWVTITSRTRGVLCELPGELLASDAAVSAWFTERATTSGCPTWAACA